MEEIDHDTAGVVLLAGPDFNLEHLARNSQVGLTAVPPQTTPPLLCTSSDIPGMVYPPSSVTATELAALTDPELQVAVVGGESAAAYSLRLDQWASLFDACSDNGNNGGGGGITCGGGVAAAHAPTPASFPQDSPLSSASFNVSMTNLSSRLSLPLAIRQLDLIARSASAPVDFCGNSRASSQRFPTGSHACALQIARLPSFTPATTHSTRDIVGSVESADLNTGKEGRGVDLRERGSASINERRDRQLLTGLSAIGLMHYCMMMTPDSFVDFHVDPAASWNFMHLSRGDLWIYLIKASVGNLAIYRSWAASGDRHNVFLGDLVDKCVGCLVTAGESFLVPAGWIYGIFARTKVVLFGYSFLTPLSAARHVVEIESEPLDSTPRLNITRLLWLIHSRYLGSLCDSAARQSAASSLGCKWSQHETSTSELTKAEMAGLLDFIGLLRHTLMIAPSNRRARALRVPDIIPNPAALLQELETLVRGFLPVPLSSDRDVHKRWPSNASSSVSMHLKRTSTNEWRMENTFAPIKSAGVHGPFSSCAFFTTLQRLKRTDNGDATAETGCVVRSGQNLYASYAEDPYRIGNTAPQNQVLQVLGGGAGTPLTAILPEQQQQQQQHAHVVDCAVGGHHNIWSPSQQAFSVQQNTAGTQTTASAPKNQWSEFTAAVPLHDTRPSFVWVAQSAAADGGGAAAEGACSLGRAAPQNGLGAAANPPCFPAETGFVQCPKCMGYFTSKGLGPHNKHCDGSSHARYAAPRVIVQASDTMLQQPRELPLPQQTQPRDRRSSCHRCGNLRSQVVVCRACPVIFCRRCSVKMVAEDTAEAFVNGCPVCKKLCCCSSRKSHTCLRIYHCYKRCKATHRPNTAPDVRSFSSFG